MKCSDNFRKFRFTKIYIKEPHHKISSDVFNFCRSEYEKSAADVKRHTRNFCVFASQETNSNKKVFDEPNYEYISNFAGIMTKIHTTILYCLQLYIHTTSIIHVNVIRFFSKEQNRY